MFALKRLVPAAALLATFALSACGDATAPEPVDPAAMQSGVEAATATFQNNPAFQSIAILSSSLPQLAPPLGLVRGTLPRVMAGTRIGAAAISASRMGAFLTLNPDALFPADLLGKTLVWSTVTNSYGTSNLTGAPANGIRLMLYFADPTTEQPFQPLQVLGYLDLTDKSTPQSDKLGVALYIVNTLVASYDITVVSGTSSGSATATGYFLDGTGNNRVDFTFVDAITAAGVLTSTNDITATDGSQVHAQLALSFSGPSTLGIRVTRGHATLELTASGDFLADPTPITGTVKFNGTSVATLGGSLDAPTLTGTNGHTFTTGETASLLTVFAIAGEIVFLVSTGVFAPGAVVFGSSAP